MQPYLSSYTDFVSPRFLFNKTPAKTSAEVVTPIMPDEGRPYSIATKCAAEFLALMTFVIIGSLQAALSNKNTDGVLNAALCHGVAIVVLVGIFAHISGGHVNPIVTLGIACLGKMPALEAVFYIVAQSLGGIVGSFLVRAILTHDQFVAIQGGATLCGTGIEWYQGFLAEIFTSMFLILTVFLYAVDEKSILAPLSIGLTVIFDILAVGAISGASMNPARSLGPNVVAAIFMNDKLKEGFWSNHWIYYAGPIIGTLLAVALHRLFFARDKRLVQ
ncbi:unnamed protein product [Cylicocyclus nassatus]|uniref:Uncharacterized protein n=1 Tax=Cylicocyclus nassatus TaxID=53992 RepID=A0AA36DNZ6_CYLNA|nr:unnamed protein product [Cylicocyclus nassatus]